MAKKPTKLIGLRLSEFNSLIEKGEEIHLQPARLIPFSKPGDEITLTSIFLSSLRLIKEFRKNISKEIGLKTGGKIHVFTEVEFCSDSYKENRPDGLILIEIGKKIVDAVLVEVKNKKSELVAQQILSYIKIATDYNIPKLLTISNQFVSYPTQSPLPIKKLPSKVSLNHFSWSYILTIAHLLLFRNNDNIPDKNQAEVMQEVLEYFESDISGILGFASMKPGWKDSVGKIVAGTPLSMSDNAVEEAVSSWLEEERDMALQLSRKLGLLVRSGQWKYKTNKMARIENEKKKLIKDKCLESILQIDGAVSDITVRPWFERRNVEMSIKLDAPLDKKTTIGRINWLCRQVENCRKKNTAIFENIEKNLMIDINIKYTSEPIRMPLCDLEYADEEVGHREIKSFNVLLLRDFGPKFQSREKIVTLIEKMLFDYYQGIVQHLRRWEKPAPKLTESADDTRSG